MGLACLFLGLLMYLSGDTNRQAMAGILTRVGFLMATIWLAWPQLEALKNRVSVSILIGIIAVLTVVAIRPRLFPIAFGIAVACFFINGIMRRFATSKR